MAPNSGQATTNKTWKQKKTQSQKMTDNFVDKEITVAANAVLKELDDWTTIAKNGRVKIYSGHQYKLQQLINKLLHLCYQKYKDTNSSVLYDILRLIVEDVLGDDFAKWLFYKPYGVRGYDIPISYLQDNGTADGVKALRKALGMLVAKPAETGQIKSAEKPSEVELIEQIAGELKNEDLVSLPPILPGLEIRIGDDDSDVNRIYNLCWLGYSTTVDSRDNRYSPRQKLTLITDFAIECDKTLFTVRKLCESFEGSISDQERMKLFTDFELLGQRLKKLVEDSITNNSAPFSGFYYFFFHSLSPLMQRMLLMADIETHMRDKALREGLQKWAKEHQEPVNADLAEKPAETGQSQLAETPSEIEIDKISAIIKKLGSLEKAKSESSTYHDEHGKSYLGYGPNSTEQALCGKEQDLIDEIELSLCELEDCIADYTKPEDGFERFFPPTGAFRRDVIRNVRAAIESGGPKDVHKLIQHIKIVKRRLELKSQHLTAEKPTGTGDEIEASSTLVTGVVAGTTDEESREPGLTGKRIKEPSKEAIQAYLLYISTGWSQEECARVMTENSKSKKPYEQYQISRMVKDCRKWLKHYGLDAFPVNMTTNIKVLSPDKLDMGARTDGKITGDPHHTKKKIDDPDGDIYN